MKKKLAQYFTPPDIANFMIQLADVDAKSAILEPSCGAGVFLEQLITQGFQNITAYEIDPTLARNYPKIHYESFVSADIQKRFELVIGNPPYIRWKHLEETLKEELLQHPLWQQHCNRLCDYLHIFILRSIALLNEGGQLIFICPEYWMNTTHSQGLRDYMLANGHFERIYQFKETPIFEGARVACVIFKFVKSQNPPPSVQIWQYESKQPLNSDTLQHINGEAHFHCSAFQAGTSWSIVPETTREQLQNFERLCGADNLSTRTCIGDVCDIANGMVSGLDKAFQWKKDTAHLSHREQAALLKVVKAKHLHPFTYEAITPYFFLNEVTDERSLKTDFPSFHAYLQAYRTQLEARYQYGREIPYWHWVLPRSWRLFCTANPRILVPCKERISNKNHFRFAYAETGVFSTQDVTALFCKEETRENILYILAFLNLPAVFHWLCHKGIVKGSIVEFSERPLARVPFRAIDWSKQEEIKLHDEIVGLTKRILHGETLLQDLQDTFEHLFALSSNT